MADKITPSRTETYEHTVNGLLRKRYELFSEAERIRDRLLAPAYRPQGYGCYSSGPLPSSQTR